MGGDRVAAAAQVGRDVGRQVAHPRPEREVRARAVNRSAFSAKRSPNRSSSGRTWLARASSHQSRWSSASSVGFGRGAVVGLAEVVDQVVQLPHVVVERRAGRGRRRPSIRRARSAVAEHLEVLRRLAGLGRRVGERRGEADPVHRRVRADADQLEHGRREVGDVAELVAERPGVGHEARGPDHERVADAAAVGVLLVPLERRVRRHRPPVGEVRVGVRAADVVEPLELLAIDSWTRLNGPIALTNPSGPPSWLAPLSDSTSTIVSSSVPAASRNPISRPRCWSKCSSIAA